MKRRDFLRTASGVAGGTAGAVAGTGTVAGQEGNESDGDGGGGGATEEVVVGPGGNLVYEPAELTIPPGTTVNFVWDSDLHNVVVESQPDGANWEGTPGAPDETYDTGYEYSFTFEVEGTYEYFCQPHLAAGMEASITVQEGGGGGGGEGGGGVQEEVDPEEMGVPFQAHFVGLATLLMMAVSLVYTFFLLKYGESPNTSGGS